MCLLYDQTTLGQKFIKTFSPPFKERHDAVEALKFSRGLEDGERLYITRCIAEYSSTDPEDMKNQKELLNSLH